MLPACNKGAGQSIGFPDVCLTPAAPSPIPLPYPNIDMNALKMPPSPNVLVTMVPTYNMLASSPMTSGMEGGAAHALFKGAGRTTMGNPKILVNSAPATSLLCPTTGNNFNNPVGATLVPSATTVLFTRRVLEGEEDSPPNRVDAKPIELAPGVIGAHVPVFTMAYVSRLALGLERLVDPFDGAAELILDLRGCPGGDFDAFVQFADDFLPANTSLCVEASGCLGKVDSDPDEHEAEVGRQRVIRTRQSNPYAIGLTLLVDGATASAAELFAACLQHQGRARVIGSTTYGKAEAQRWMATDGGAMTYATVARYSLPDGAPIHHVGVTPDVQVPDDVDALMAAVTLARGERPEAPFAD